MSTTAADKVALRDVRVFDGQQVGAPSTVVLDGGLIGNDPAGARTVDCGGAVLLPGLIDAHVHLDGPESLRLLAGYGVTTGLDMASWPDEFVDSLRGLRGVADFRSPGTPAIGPAGPHTRMPGMPAEAVVRDPEYARRFVAARAAAGADYVKIVLEAPGDGGPEADAATALVEAAREHGKQVVAHAATGGAWELALDIGADVITHIPIGSPLEAALVARVAEQGIPCVPTLSMMEGIAAARGRPEAFAAAVDSVAALHEAGVPVLAGTDAHEEPGPTRVAHGTSLHHELELLVAAGLEPAEVLRSVTSLPARHFGLPDRGAVVAGLRADLVLIDEDPLVDVRATRSLRRIWCGGVEISPEA